ncbi:MAG: class I SAM-dependent methyltransferase [Chloroflexota bacterium]|nr:MAG: class I SAM-dependent methyltransferase [Chloroflexota bacterium]
MQGKYFLPRLTGRCLGCGNKLPDAFLDLGEMPLANSYVAPESKDKEEILYRLAVAYCPACYLVQITHRVAPEQLFSSYSYFSSFSNSFLKHAEAMAESLTKKFVLDSNSLIAEIGSNDGYLLNFFRERGIPILGIEPAKNIARVANESGIPTVDVFFGPDSVAQIIKARGQADIIIGNNVLAHVPLINDFLLSVNKYLKPTGSAVFEFPYLKDLLDHAEFDTIYHEHVFYYSVSAVKILAERAKLQLYDVHHQDIHGGSLRVFLQKERQHEVSSNIRKMLLKEEQYGIMDKDLYRNFGEKVEKLKTKLEGLLLELKKAGKTIAAYGAAAKGNTLLNYIGIDKNMIDFVVDRSPYKQGLLLPGTRIPILHQDELLKRMPDYTLVLAWNFAEEILAQQDEYRKRGGKFIIPIPEIQVI